MGAGGCAAALCLALAAAACLVLSLQTAELRGRVAALEARGGGPPGPALLALLQPHVEQLLREVSAPRRAQPQPGGPAAAMPCERHPRGVRSALLKLSGDTCRLPSPIGRGGGLRARCPTI